MAGRVRLVVAYQGTRYHGWQIQPNRLTVQEVLEQAYFRMTGQHTRIIAAGRTDRGVHAAGQVVCLDNPSRHDPLTLLRGLNACLPEDMAVLWAEAVSAAFDPGRNAVGKHYCYSIHNSLHRPVFERAFRWHLRNPLDPEAMNRSAKCLVGEHDFSAFRASGCQAMNPLRRVDWVKWSAELPLLRLDVFGNGFLKQMVRNIVGTCVEVGRGRMQPERISTILSGKDRRQAGPTAPAQGLCLLKIYYDRDEYLQAITISSTGKRA